MDKIYRLPNFYAVTTLFAKQQSFFSLNHLHTMGIMMKSTLLNVYISYPESISWYNKILEFQCTRQYISKNLLLAYCFLLFCSQYTSRQFLKTPLSRRHFQPLLSIFLSKSTCLLFKFNFSSDHQYDLNILFQPYFKQRTVSLQISVSLWYSYSNDFLCVI